VPEREYEETMNKAQALLKALNQAETAPILGRNHAATR